MKQIISGKFLFAFIILLLINYGCKDNDIENAIQETNANIQLEKKASTTAFFHKDACSENQIINDKASSNALSSMAKSAYYTYSTERLFTPSQAGNIKVFSDLGDSPFDSWSSYVDQAIDHWNNTNTCLNLSRVNNINQADIIIRDGPTTYADYGIGFPSSFFGLEIEPSTELVPQLQGDHHSNVYINKNFLLLDPISGLNRPPTINEKKHIIVHELGHSLGFHHQAPTSGGFSNSHGVVYVTIPGVDFYNSSIMYSGIVGNSNDAQMLTPDDLLAADYVYNCMDGIFLQGPSNSISLANINGFCYPSETFNVNGSFINQDGGTSTRVQLCFTEITGGLTGPVCVIQNLFSGSNFSFSNIDLNSIPGFTFNSANPYTVEAKLVGINSSIFSNSVDLPFDQCFLLPCLFEDFGFTTPWGTNVGFNTVIYDPNLLFNNYLRWNDIAEEYTLEFTVDYFGILDLPNEGNIYTVTTTNNFVDLNNIQIQSGGFAWSVRIKTDNCSWSNSFSLIPPW